jgi:pimeloyl-ACP methyl ester carboxylesterase
MLTNKHFRFRTGAPPLFSDEELLSLTMPVLFLAGENDAFLNTPKTVKRLQKLVPNLTVNLMKDDGHAAINMAPNVIPFLKTDIAVNEAVITS